MTSNTPIKLRIPRQDLSEFTLFQLNADAALIWAQALPVTNTREVAIRLRQAVSELNRIELAPELRYNIMEALRPNLLVALSNLSKRFLNQPLVMPEEPRQTAELANSLYSLTGTGYTITAIQALQQRDSIRNMNPARLLCESIHRAIDFTGRKILHTFQLYRPVELRNWLTLHQLYALAERQKLAELPVEDEQLGTSTVCRAYLQALMLGCCKANQLRQSDLSIIHRAMREWAQFIRLQRPNGTEGLFFVDLDSDQPPIYSSLYRETPGNHCRIIDSEPLVEHLQTLRQKHGEQGIALDKDTRITTAILDHVIWSFGKMSQRNFARATSDKILCISIGLSNAHFYLAGELGFDQLLHGREYIAPAAERVSTNPFLTPVSKGDLWQQANPEEDYSRQEITNEREAEAEHEVQVDPETLAALGELESEELPVQERHPVHRVQMVDASPGGYCLEWTTELPGDIKTGDLVSVREEQSADWVIAVIRWVSQLDNTRTLIGLELLSPRVMPYGAIVQEKTGNQTAPMRVLLLPEIKLVGQPHTLITPRAGFRERQKITLIREGEEFFIQLLRMVATTGSFAQFDFRYIRQLGDVVAEDKSGPLDASYDSLWTNI